MKDNKAVFGLTSVQQFFAIILGLALLAYVIVVIMGTLNNSTIIPTGTQVATVVNETSTANSTGDAVSTVGVLGFSNPTVVIAYNRTGGQVITTNVTLSSAGILTNATAVNYNNVSLTYTYNYNSQNTNNANDILSNTSTGITSFFSAINPVYAILAILVIILVLVVLVRVVTGSTSGGKSYGEPQL